MTALEYIAKALATNKVKDYYPEHRQVALDIYYMMNIHMQGIRPRYRNLRLYSDAANVSGNVKDGIFIDYPTGGTGAGRYKQWITPTGWQPKYQPYFENEILNRYPTMREERFHWQCSVYPKFPQSLFLQAIDEIRGAIFQESNYEYIFANENTELFCKAKNFDGLDIYDYITDILTPAIVNDPNGAIVVYPNDFYRVNETEGMPQDEDAGMPEIEYISSEQILYCSDDLLAWHEHRGAFVVDSEDYYFIPFDHNGKKYLTSEAVVLPHVLGVAPFRQLGGYKMYSKDLGHYYLSFFSGAIDWANIAVRDFLDVQAAKKDLIPITQQIEIECNTCHGVGSVPVLCEDGSAGCSASCSNCNGKGTISRNLGDVITVDRQDIVDGKMPDYLRYISADVASLNAMSTEFDGLYKRFQEALYLKFSDLAQSGIAKEMDREKLYKFLMSFSNNLFNIVADLLTYIDALLNNTEVNNSHISVRRPTQFKLKTDSDLRDELRQLQTAGADEMAVKTVSDSLTMLASDNTVTEYKLEILSLYDPLRYKTDQQKTNMVIVAGAFTKEDLIRSARASNELDRIIHAYGSTWFLQASYETIKTMLDNAMQPYLDQLEQQPVLMP